MAYIDCTNISNYQTKTVNDFYYDITHVEVPNEATGTMNFTKTYNANTGKLTINRSAIAGVGLILFKINVYTHG